MTTQASPAILDDTLLTCLAEPSAHDPLALREQIQSLEDQMAQMPQVELEVRHHYADGLYARELRIPAGVALTGAVHLFEHLNIISQGEILVATEDGPRHVVAPATIVSRPGTKRLGLALTDTVWTTIHANPTNEQDVLRLEQQLVVKTHDALTAEDIHRLREVLP